MTAEHRIDLDFEPETNVSGNRDFDEVAKLRMGRRAFLGGSLSLAAAGLFASPRSALARSTARSALLGFTPVPPGRGDAVVVPDGYRAEVVYRWGDPIVGDRPAFSPDNTAEEQGQQAGMHHDGMHFFPLEGRSDDGLLVVNHEYVEARYLHAAARGQALDSWGVPAFDGVRPADQVRKEMTASGLSVARIRRNGDGRWSVAEDPRNRRVTVLTEIEIAGPARGDARLKTRFSPEGTRTRGTLGNCAHGVTPWGTYLAAEENWSGYFLNDDETHPREHARYGVRRERSNGAWTLAEGGADEYVRFDAGVKGERPEDDYRNEPNTFGWPVEIDPFDPEAAPVKRTHLGRFAHEGVIFAPAEAGEPVVCYSGDDARFEYIYKFVSAAPFQPGTTRGDILDAGTLYVARFNADGAGDWLALAPGENGLTPENGFENLADILVNTRSAADFVGATRMDRPEWGAVDPQTRAVYFTLTNNSDREIADAANPRIGNRLGAIIRWTERGGQAGTRFDWDHFVLAGPQDDSRDANGEALGEDAIFACPDGLWFDADRRLWIQTDISDGSLNAGVYAPFGNNQMLAADPDTGEIRRFLTGVPGCEITGVVTTPDRRTMFINIQHPGADTSAEDFAAGRFSSRFADDGTGVPRSATIAITREDGGVIGA